MATVDRNIGTHPLDRTEETTPDETMPRRDMVQLTAAFIVAATYGAAQFIAGRKEVADKALDQNEIGPIYQQVFQEASTELADQDPTIEQKAAAIRWRELAAPSIFHTAGDMLTAQHKRDLASGDVKNSSNMFLQAVRGDTAQMKVYVKRIIQRELREPQRYAELPRTETVPVKTNVDKEECCEALELLEEFRKPHRTKKGA